MSRAEKLFLVLAALMGVSFGLFVMGPTMARGQQYVSVTVRGSTKELEWCPGTAVSTLTSAQTLPDRKNIAIQNLSSATCYVVFDPPNTTTTPDPTNPTTTGSRGWKFGPSDTWSFDYGPTIPTRAACTAAQTTGACLQVLQAK